VVVPRGGVLAKGGKKPRGSLSRGSQEPRGKQRWQLVLPVVVVVVPNEKRGQLVKMRRFSFRAIAMINLMDGD